MKDAVGESAMRYAEVAVNVPFPRRRASGRRHPSGRDISPMQTFHYAIPEAWHGHMRPGHLVQVPFGKQDVQGIVIDVGDSSPVEEHRYLSAILDDSPVISPAGIALAQWMAQYYLSTLFSALQCMLPPGMEQRSRLTLVWQGSDTLPVDLGVEAASLARLLHKRGSLRSDQLNRLFPEKVWRKGLSQLSARGLATASVQLRQPKVQTRFEQTARLRVEDPIRALLSTSIRRHTKETRLLSRLLEEGVPIPLETLLAEEGTKRTEVKKLEKRGLVRISAAPAQVSLAVQPEEAIDAWIRLRRLEKHRSALEFLAGQTAPISVEDVSAGSEATSRELRELAEAGLIAIDKQAKMRDPLAGTEYIPDIALKFTPDQERVWQTIAPELEEHGLERRPFLLHGVTGSGKTEIYLQALAKVLDAGRQAIVLVPEISLTPQTIRRFASRFPGRVTTIHSQLSLGERYDQWRQIRNGEVDIVVGPRSAIFAPTPRLGLIVLDEEHEDAYKSESMPYYHAREVAVQRARLEGCSLILGSATPSVESYFLAEKGVYKLNVMPQRVMGHRRGLALPDDPAQADLPSRRVTNLDNRGEETIYMGLPAVRVVDLREELRAGNRSIFSRALQGELSRVLARGEQAILFLNRRGTATVVTCRDCGYVARCERCHVAMTFHSGQRELICHHCNLHTNLPATCPACGSRRIRFLGTGTEKVEEALYELFPEARVLRWDRDATRSKGSHQAILDRFIAREADILVGTQMIAKGLDLPLVTLVGVVLADTALYLPDFRAAERTFQLMVQVSGRAGRSVLGGCVVIQTYTPDQYCIRFAAQHDYLSFYRHEVAIRRALDYPPFSRLAVLRYGHTNAGRAQAEAERLAQALHDHLDADHQAGRIVSGPAPSFFSRVRGRYRWQIVLAAEDPAQILGTCDIPAGWRIDIDPTSLL